MTRGRAERTAGRVATEARAATAAYHVRAMEAQLRGIAAREGWAWTEGRRRRLWAILERLLTLPHHDLALLLVDVLAAHLGPGGADAFLAGLLPALEEREEEEEEPGL